MVLSSKRVRLPTITVIVGDDATDDDAKAAASKIIKDKLGFKHFEILNVCQIKGDGCDDEFCGKRRYQVTFRKLRGEVVYVHPDFNKIFSAT